MSSIGEKGGVEIRVLFVCLGNICRSPLAEGLFKHLAAERGLAARFIVDSCGTGDWHAGEPPDPRMARVAKKRGVSLNGQRARQISGEDLRNFDVVVAMDRSNLRDVKGLGVKPRGELFLLRDYDPRSDDPDVPDPYYGGADGFDEVFDIVKRCCECLLERFESEL